MYRTITFALCLIGANAHAAPPAAYREVAGAVGLQPSLLYAVARTESARAHYPHPWPWTANIRGQGYYYPSRQALYQALRRELARGNDRFDVGLMQINWHANAHWFASLWEATDPRKNLAAGARHLQTLSRRYGLDRAIALYHVGSMTTAERRRRGQQYRVRVQRNLDGGRR
ncbi:MAG TPA: lytic transglycosylase [Gammaproteobacteria bacterium]|nr:lytic transglycosylase [Gammaproteobacteria bacterium]